jgi:hypothetical protein
VIVGRVVEIVPCVLDGGGGDGLHVGDDQRGTGEGKGSGGVGARRRREVMGAAEPRAGRAVGIGC